jgi:hypothetical protein
MSKHHPKLRPLLRASLEQTRFIGAKNDVGAVFSDIPADSDFLASRDGLQFATCWNS